MINIINTRHDNATVGYSNYQKADTKIPPKTKPLLKTISVNGVAIEETDILAEAQNHCAETPEAALIQAAQALVIRQLLWQEVQSENLSPDLLPDENGRMETRQDAGIAMLIEKNVKAPQADEFECKRYYENNPQRCKSKTIFEMRHILIIPENSNTRNSSAKSWDNARKRAEELISIILSDRDKFETLARENSACPSARNGGSLGQVMAGTTVPEFETGVDKMDEGSISTEPLKSRYGFHIIALDRKIAGDIFPYEVIEPRLRAWLEAKSWSKAVTQYISMLAGKSEIIGIHLDGTDSPLTQ